MELFGEKMYGSLSTNQDKVDFALPRIRKMLKRWMKGKPLSKLEQALGTNPDNLKKCEGARKFVIRMIPELAYLFGLPGLLHERAQIDLEEKTTLPSSIAMLGLCVRLGYNSVEKLALAQSLNTSDSLWSRRQVHKHFKQLEPYLTEAQPGETWETNQTAR